MEENNGRKDKQLVVKLKERKKILLPRKRGCKNGLSYHEDNRREKGSPDGNGHRKPGKARNGDTNLKAKGDL